MKLLTKSLIYVAVASVSAPATAALITKNVAYGETDALAAQSAFLSGSFNQVTENFDNFNPDEGVKDSNGDLVTNTNIAGSDQQSSWVLASPSFATAVGTFSMKTKEDPTGSDDVDPENLMIENLDTGEFGRETPGNWLDSNDAFEVTWNIMDGNAGGRNAIGFFLSDPNDVNAVLKLEFVDGFSDTIQIDAPLPNNELIYVTIFSSLAFNNAVMTFNNSTNINDSDANTNDGWGIDEVTVAQVPEPGTLALLGLGLAAIGISRQRKVKS
jgi:PEP-CTERM motif